PSLTAEISTNRRAVTWLTTVASVVLPVPGGPHSTSDIGASRSTSCRIGVPGPSRWAWPTTSSSARGRIRTASGCPALGTAWGGSAGAAESGAQDAAPAAAPASAGASKRPSGSPHSVLLVTLRHYPLTPTLRAPASAGRGRTADGRRP